MKRPSQHQHTISDEEFVVPNKMLDEYSKRPHRQICALCHRQVTIDFWVPDKIWFSVVHNHYKNSIHCLNCFIIRADESLIEWDREIKLWPISMARQMGITLDKSNWVRGNEILREYFLDNEDRLQKPETKK